MRRVPEAVVRRAPDLPLPTPAAAAGSDGEGDEPGARTGRRPAPDAAGVKPVAAAGMAARLTG